MLEIDKRSIGPNLPLHFGTCDKLARTFQEHQEHLQRLALKRQTPPLLAEFARLFVGLK
jgi:hypothetical protein